MCCWYDQELSTPDMINVGLHGTKDGNLTETFNV